MSKTARVKNFHGGALLGDAETLNRISQKYAVRVTDHALSTIQGPVTSDPVARQYIPQLRELKILPEENVDPIGDGAHSPVKGIVHRYPDRALFKLTNVCAVYCRYCFRREMIGPGSESLSAAERETAMNYIRSHKDIWEVILTGGDPLILSPKKLSAVLDELCTIEHVQVVRIHTRVPIADPAKVTETLSQALARNKPVYVVLHINHAQEITPEVEHAISNLQNTGCVLLSQSVLLKGVNDNAETLEALFRRLITLKVKPYYLHHPDLAPGTSHFRLSLEEGQNIMKSLQGRVSGICLPRYMLDIPGGHGKVPVNPCYIKELETGDHSVEDYQGNEHLYPPKAKP